MRLKKKDLVKDFELLTKQEIKNYQDTVNATHLSLNYFRKRLKEIEADFLKKFADIKNDLSSQNVERENDLEFSAISIKNLKNFLYKHVAMFDSRVSKIESNLEDNHDFLKEEDLEKIESTIKQIEEKIKINSKNELECYKATCKELENLNNRIIRDFNQIEELKEGLDNIHKRDEKREKEIRDLSYGVNEKLDKLIKRIEDQNVHIEKLYMIAAGRSRVPKRYLHQKEEECHKQA